MTTPEPDITRTDRDPFDMGGWANVPAFPGTPGFSAYIQGQEAAGQRELVTSTRFPAEAPIADLEALGFTFGPVDEHDPLFRTATLPEGWRREGSGHAMWSYILDDKGRRRVSIFYKAAFYDRRAFAHLVEPTARLSDAIYSDDEPGPIGPDELLTLEVAREYLGEELASAREDLATWAKGEPRYEARARRIEQLLASLPAGDEATEATR